MNPNMISAQMCNKSEKFGDLRLQNEEYDPYIIVILNQLWWSKAEGSTSLLSEMILILKERSHINQETN